MRHLHTITITACILAFTAAALADSPNDGNQLHDPKPPATAPTDKPNIKTLSIDGGKYSATIDTTDTPELTEWASKDLAPIVAEWYPKIVKLLPSDGFDAPKKFTLTFKKKMDGVAYTAGINVVGAEKYFLAHLDDKGAIVHELVHVVQQYRSRKNPGWLVEGLADYVRWFIYEPESKRPIPDPKKAKYTDGYRTTAAFLNYIVKNHDQNFIVKINADLRNGKYSPNLWKTYTGKSLDELWNLYLATLKK